MEIRIPARMRIMDVVGAVAHDRKKGLGREIIHLRQFLLQGRQAGDKDKADCVWESLDGHYLLSKLERHIIISVQAFFPNGRKVLCSHFTVSPRGYICSEGKPFCNLHKNATQASTGTAISLASRGTGKQISGLYFGETGVQKGCLKDSGKLRKQYKYSP